MLPTVQFTPPTQESSPRYPPPHLVHETVQGVDAHRLHCLQAVGTHGLGQQCLDRVLRYVGAWLNC